MPFVARPQYELVERFPDRPCGFSHGLDPEGKPVLVPAKWELFERKDLPGTGTSETKYYVCEAHKRSYLGESPIPSSELPKILGVASPSPPVETASEGPSPEEGSEDAETVPPG